MFESYAEPVREYDSDGNLGATGARWSEDRILIFLVTTPLMAFLQLLILIVVALGLYFSKGDYSVLIMMVTVMSAVTWWIWCLLEHFATRDAMFIFHADGTMEVPTGLPYRKRPKFVEGDHANIVSIEARKNNNEEQHKMGWGYEVCLYVTNGNIIRVATCLMADEAHRVAVLLTAALRAMRQSQTTAQTLRPKPQAKAPRQRELID